MDKVSSARDSGIFFRTYNKHDGVYLGRATVDADLPGGMLFLRITNYTSKMENVYCLFYEMDGPNNVQTCHSQALLLRNVDSEVPGTVENTMTTVTDKTENTEIPQSATEAGEPVSQHRLH
ncbi:hypothetical protein OS493_006564 [Desmophyllum pertusum]|uniref:Uncharacterized protein n=1 Tax=Desmophyllum pertusum TaxID=174260 RepID=A0A9X0A8L9_9CNID|nr:hypothetical protein OS493_006564 [Desmophyllum pertusum]